MRLLNDLHNYRYVLWILSAFFLLALFFGPKEGSLGTTTMILSGLSVSLLLLYLVLKYIYKKKSISEE